jgi:DNA-directed RNA polymerase subunit RPC12/RpoP
MTAGLDAKKTKKNEIVAKTSGVLGIWSCGCTTIGCVTPVNIRCIKCGNEFKKVSKKNNMNKTKAEKAKIELVQTMYSEEGDGINCQRCGDTGETKVFTQEWDMIKSHMSPCPDCRSQEWLEWSDGKRLVGNY